ncbi:MAG: hypothetical protein QOF24_3015 [Verrucomicrobiota bacterium]|jgi:hypothetical protein
MNDTRQRIRIAEAVSTLNQKYGSKNPSTAEAVPVDVGRIVLALDEFMECVRYLNTRRSSTVLTLDSEAAVQDAIYLMLRPWVLDLVPENPTERIAASRYAIKDFVSRSVKAVIEAKFIRDAAHGKSITKELHDDIETYRSHQHCENLIFFIYDPDVLIPDKAALGRQIVTPRTYAGVPLTCYLIVKP